MPEPLSALSVAAAIVQFVDFGGRLLCTSFGAYSSVDGCTEGDARLSTVHKDLKALADRLLQPPAASTLERANHEIVLQELARECCKLADRLLTLLARLEVKGQGLPRAWGALRAAIRRVARAGEIEGLQRALDNIRSELNARSLSDVRETQSSFLLKLDQLQKDAQDTQIVNATALKGSKKELLAATETIRRELKHGSDLSHALQHATMQRIEAQMDLMSQRLDVLEIISRDTADVKRLLRSLLNPQDQALTLGISTRVNALKVTYRADANAHDLLDYTGLSQAQSQHETIHQLTSASENMPVENAKVIWILQSLEFPRSRSRYGAIQHPHGNTCEWLFGQKTSSFTLWLETDSRSRSSSASIFWTNGKGGAGKSTLMKFINNNEQTRMSLNRWAKGRRLITASFYFWEFGSFRQRSQLGMLQSLLLQILQQMPELTPLAVSYRWTDDAFQSQLPYAFDWTMSELLSSLHAAISVASRAARPNCFCFFIDGLDKDEPENGRDRCDLTKEMRRLATWPNVKLCVSSRPRERLIEGLGRHDFQIIRMENYLYQT